MFRRDDELCKWIDGYDAFISTSIFLPSTEHPCSLIPNIVIDIFPPPIRTIIYCNQLSTPLIHSHLSPSQFPPSVSPPSPLSKPDRVPPPVPQAQYTYSPLTLPFPYAPAFRAAEVSYNLYSFLAGDRFSPAARKKREENS